MHDSHYKRPLPDPDEIDLNRIIAKPLYFALFTNIVLPMLFMMLCYYQSEHGGVPDRLGESAQTLFYVFAALALAHAGYGFWWKCTLIKQPMVRRAETFEADITEFLDKRTRPIFLVIAAISLYGFIFFLLSGRFQEVVFMVFFSFIVFQVVRPRYGMVKKVIDRQLEMVSRGEFRKE